MKSARFSTPSESLTDLIRQAEVMGELARGHVASGEIRWVTDNELRWSVQAHTLGRKLDEQAGRCDLGFEEIEITNVQRKACRRHASRQQRLRLLAKTDR